MKRYERQYGVNQQALGMPSGEAGAARGVQQALSGFTSAIGSAAIQGFERQNIVKAEKQAMAYDPATGKPVMSERNTKSARIYNAKVMEAHQQHIDYELRAKLTSLSYEYENDPDSFNAASNVYLKEAASNMHPAVAQEMLPKYQYLQQSAYSSIKNTVEKAMLKRSNEDAVNWAGSTIESIAKSYRNGDDEAGYEDTFTFAQQVQDSVNLDTDQKAAIFNDLTREVFTAQIVAGLPDEPLMALAQLEASRDQVPDVFTRDEWDTLISKEITKQNAKVAIGNKIDAEIQAELGGVADTLSVEINRLETPDEQTITLMQESISMLKNKGYKGWATIQKQLDNSIKEISVSANAYAEFNSAMENGTTYFGDIDDVYPNYSKQLEGDPYELEKNLQVIEKTSQVPKLLVERTSRELLSSDPDVLLSAANTALKVRSYASDHTNETPFTDEQIAYAQHIKDGITIGMDAQSAIDKATQLTRPANPEYVNQRTEQFNDDHADDFIGYTRNDFGGVFSTPVDELNEAVLSKDYERFTKRFYTLGVEFDLARVLAEESVKQIWGKSVVGDRLMRYPPENYYALGDDERGEGWINDQLLEDTQGMGFTHVFLTADERTGSEQYPSYLVWGVTESGISVLPQRFRPDPQGEFDAREAENLARASGSLASAERERLGIEFDENRYRLKSDAAFQKLTNKEKREGRKSRLETANQRASK